MHDRADPWFQDVRAAEAAFLKAALRREEKHCSFPPKKAFPRLLISFRFKTKVRDPLKLVARVEMIQVQTAEFKIALVYIW